MASGYEKSPDYGGPDWTRWQVVLAVALMLAAIAAVAALITGARAEEPARSLERAFQEKLCTGMELEHLFPDDTRADCLSAEYVIEVDFTEKWAESIGQALHYALWTDELPIGHRKAGIILICHKARDTCTDHVVRLRRVIDAFRLPIRLWDCEAADSSLAQCQVITANSAGGRRRPPALVVACPACPPVVFGRGLPGAPAGAPLMIATLGEALDHGWKLRIYCRGHKGQAMKKHRACVAYHDADLETLVWTRGREFPIAMLASRLKCPRCNSRLIAIAFEVPKTPAAGAVDPGRHWTRRMTG